MVRTLTDRFAAGIRPTDLAGQTNAVFDTKAQGLALRVGARTKVRDFVHRHGGAPSKWLRLGRYPALTLAEARRRVRAEHAKLDRPAEPARAVSAVLSPETIEQLGHAVAAVVVRALRQEFARHD